MKFIIAIIQPTRLDAVKEALNHIEVYGCTISDVQGMGRQKGHTEIYRGHEYHIQFVRKVKLELAVDDHLVDPTIDAIIAAARTGEEGKIGDGKIFVLPLEDAVRIRTHERGAVAL